MKKQIGKKLELLKTTLVRLNEFQESKIVGGDGTGTGQSAGAEYISQRPPCSKRGGFLG